MDKVSYTKRISYAASDTAGQLVFCVISFYLPNFYTDVYGISAAAAGTILLLARFIDAFDAPIWGIIFDKTHSRWGKSRPWFLWLCVPFAVFGVLTFLTPELGPTAKLFYAGSTYVICSVLYTGINTPVTSILSALTPDPQQRVILTSYRMYGSKLGALIVNLTVLHMVGWLGGEDHKKGFMLVMLIYAAGAIGLYLLAFRNLEEVVKEDKEPQSIAGNFGAIRGNWPWIIIFVSSLFFWIGFISRISAVPFLFKYTLNREDLIPFANGLDFISLATVFFLPAFCKWTFKRNAWLLGLAGMVVGQLIAGFGLHYQASLSIILTGWAIGYLASGFAMAMPFSVLADSVDYGEWKTGVRAPGLLTAIGAAFCLKAGSGFGGALPVWIMGAYGYVPNVEQTPSALFGIEIGIIWLPAVFFALAAIPVWFYKKYEQLEPQIRADLEQRRAAANKKAEYV